MSFWDNPLGGIGDFLKGSAGMIAGSIMGGPVGAAMVVSSAMSTIAGARGRKKAKNAMVKQQRKVDEQIKKREAAAVREEERQKRILQARMRAMRGRARGLRTLLSGLETGTQQPGLRDKLG